MVRVGGDTGPARPLHTHWPAEGARAGTARLCLLTPSLEQEALTAHDAILLFGQAFVQPLINNDLRSSVGEKGRGASRRFNLL